jgi:hypothetical protein
MHMYLILFTLDAWDKVSTMFIICFGFWGFQTIASLNSFDWLLLHSATMSISILQHTLSEVCHPLLSMKIGCPWRIPGPSTSRPSLHGEGVFFNVHVVNFLPMWFNQLETHYIQLWSRCHPLLFWKRVILNLEGNGK